MGLANPSLHCAALSTAQDPPANAGSPCSSEAKGPTARFRVDSVYISWQIMTIMRQTPTTNVTQVPNMKSSTLDQSRGLEITAFVGTMAGLALLLPAFFLDQTGLLVGGCALLIPSLLFVMR